MSSTKRFILVTMVAGTNNEHPMLLRDCLAVHTARDTVSECPPMPVASFPQSQGWGHLDHRNGILKPEASSVV
jgi:hypothetical protein